MEPDRERYRPPLEENILVCGCRMGVLKVCCDYFIGRLNALEFAMRLGWVECDVLRTNTRW